MPRGIEDTTVTASEMVVIELIEWSCSLWEPLKRLGYRTILFDIMTPRTIFLEYISTIVS